MHDVAMEIRYRSQNACTRFGAGLGHGEMSHRDRTHAGSVTTREGMLSAGRAAMHIALRIKEPDIKVFATCPPHGGPLRGAVDSAHRKKPSRTLPQMNDWIQLEA